MTIEEIQEECKIRFPINCIFICPLTEQQYKLNESKNRYKIINYGIDAGFERGYLYYLGKYAELVSLSDIVDHSHLLKLLKRLGIK